MLIQGVTLREKAAIEKNKLYAFSQSKTIHYVEEKSGNVDIVLAGVKYWRHGVVAYLEECMIEEEIGVFTENFEPSRIKTEIDRLESANMSCEPEKIPPLILGKMNIEKLKRTQELEVLRDFVEYQFTYKEGMASEKLSFKVRTLDGKKEHYLRLEV